MRNEMKKGKCDKLDCRRRQEIETVNLMIDVYARKHNDFSDAEDLKAYAAERIRRCPRMEQKTFCSACPIHCYREKERQQIKEVMRFSGPRMIFYHPVKAIAHAWISHHDLLVRGFWLMGGLFGLVLGFLGAILPLLPAFPFVLMAACCFAKSSKRLHSWFVETNLYKNNVKEWVDHRGMRRSVKRRVLMVITLVMLAGFAMMSRVPWARWILVAVWIGHVLYFRYGMKTLPENIAAA